MMLIINSKINTQQFLAQFMNTNRNLSRSRTFLGISSQSDKIDHSNQSSKPNSEACKEFSYNNSYYEISKQHYKTKGRGENMSDLSVLIYEGLQTVRKEAYQNNFVSKMEETYKKQLELQIQQCKELQGLTMMSILKDKQCQILEKQSKIEGEIGNLKEQLHWISKKLKQESSNLNLVQQKTHEHHTKILPFSIVKKGNSKGKMQKNIHNDIQQNTYLTVNQQNSIQNESKQVNFNRFYQSQNQSTMNSRGSSYLTCQLPGVSSTSPGRINEKKVLLFKRMNLMKEEKRLTDNNFQKRAEIIKSEISLLKKELSIINQNIQKDSPIESKKNSLSPLKGNTESRLREKSRNPRFTSQGSKKSQKTLGLKQQKNKARPSMFHHQKVSHFGPSIYRCASQNKIYHQITINPTRLNSDGQKKLSQVRSNLLEHTSSDDYFYFTNRKPEINTEKKYGTNRKKNAYFN